MYGFFIFKIFLLNGFDINLINKYGNTPLYYLCQNEFITLELINLFISFGSNVNITNKLNQSILQQLCCNPKLIPEMIESFIVSGVNITHIDTTENIDLKIYKNEINI